MNLPHVLAVDRLDCATLWWRVCVDGDCLSWNSWGVVLDLIVPCPHHGATGQQSLI